MTAARLTPGTPGPAPSIVCATSGQVCGSPGPIYLKRLLAILYALALRYDAIWYFCPKPVLESMQRAVAQLDPTVRRKFSLVELPKSGPPPQGSQPPRPHPPATRMAELAAGEASGQHEAETIAGPRGELAGQSGQGASEKRSEAAHEPDHSPKHPRQCFYRADTGEP